MDRAASAAPSGERCWFFRKRWGWGASVDFFALSEDDHKEFLEGYKTYIAAIKRAAKYPLSRKSLIVQRWIAGQQSVGNYSVPRGLGIGAESGIGGDRSGGHVDRNEYRSVRGGHP